MYRILEINTHHRLKTIELDEFVLSVRKLLKMYGFKYQKYDREDSLLFYIKEGGVMLGRFVSFKLLEHKLYGNPVVDNVVIHKESLEELAIEGKLLENTK